MGGLTSFTQADGCMELAPQPVEETLRKRREYAAKQLADIDAALALLDKNPGLLETLNVLRRVGI